MTRSWDWGGLILGTAAVMGIVLALVCATIKLTGDAHPEREYIYVVSTSTGELLFNGDVRGGVYQGYGNTLEWRDTQGVWHKHFVSGGQMIHVSDRPLSFSTGATSTGALPKSR